MVTEVGTHTAALNRMAVTRVFHRTADPNLTLFIISPYPPPVTGYSVNYRIGQAAHSVNTGMLTADIDAVTARTAPLAPSVIV